MISVLILTLNEELNIEACVRSIPWSSDVHVLDSCSTDGTRMIAQSLGANVVERAFTDYAEQRNFGLSLPFQNEWILMLDADERMTPALAEEIEEALLSAGPDDTMFRVRRRDYLMGTWIRRSSGYPTWFPRVFRKSRTRVERAVNESYLTDGYARQLKGHLSHFPFNKGIDWWFERHNRYSDGEARLLISAEGTRSSLGSMFSRDPTERRAGLKGLAYRLPGRPFLIFIYLYFVRLGFLDGPSGFHFASMRFAYEVMIDAKVAVLRRAKRDGTDLASR